MVGFYFGIKARYNRISKVKQLAPGVEIHEEYEDIEENFENQVKILNKEVGDRTIVIHCPVKIKGEWFGMDFSKIKPVARKLFGLTERLQNRKKMVLLHIFGGNRDKKEEILEVIQIVKELLDELPENTFLLIETMYSSQVIEGFHERKLFSRAVDYIEMFKQINDRRLGICADLSHMKIEENFAGEDMIEFIQKLGERIYHVHASDAKGIEEKGGEGLEIGEGEINFKKVFDELKKKITMDVMIVPEVVGDHLRESRSSIRSYEKLKELASIKATPGFIPESSSFSQEGLK